MFELVNLTIEGNVSSGRAGGIYAAGNVTLISSTVSNNTAAEGGGGLYSVGFLNRSVTLANSTISGNTSFENGGGIYNDYRSLVLTNVTVVENVAQGNEDGATGGGIWTNTDDQAFTTIHNSIVSNNTDGSGNADNLGGNAPEAESEANLFGSSPDLDEGQTLDSTKNLVGIDDPLLGPLQDNGGPTFTHEPLSGSPVIDAAINDLALDRDGAALEFDQRGEEFERIVDGTVDIGAVEFQPTTFRVEEVIPTTSGFIVQFSEDFAKEPINIYGTDTADLTFLGPDGSVLVGSLVTTQDSDTIQFVTTGAILEAGTYTLTLRSASDAFQNIDGDLLDGDADGVAGSDFTTRFTVASFLGATLSLPDFTRGAGQEIDLPVGTSGLPITIEGAAGVDRVSFVLNFDATLLDVTGASLGADAPSGSTVLFSVVDSGQVSVEVTTPGGLPAGSLELIRLEASVPSTAPLTEKQALSFDDLIVEVSGTPRASRGRDAIHLATYLGDVFVADQSYSIQDASELVTASFGNPLTEYPNADPVLVADVNGNGVLDIEDASLLISASLGQLVPSLPSRPSVTPPITSGLDPLLEVGRVTAISGETVRVPLSLTNTDVVTVGVETIQEVIEYDPTQVSIAGLSAGSLGEEYGLLWHADASSGLLFVVGSRAIPLELSPGDGGVLGWLELEVSASLEAGDRVGLNLRSDVATYHGTLATGLNGGTLILIPAPTNGWDDPVDGSIDVVASVLSEGESEAKGASGASTSFRSRSSDADAGMESKSLSDLLNLYSLVEVMDQQHVKFDLLVIDGEEDADRLRS